MSGGSTCVAVPRFEGQPWGFLSGESRASIKLSDDHSLVMYRLEAMTKL
jgi:hypothetical protein